MRASSRGLATFAAVSLSFLPAGALGMMPNNLAKVGSLLECGLPAGAGT